MRNVVCASIVLCTRGRHSYRIEISWILTKCPVVMLNIRVKLYKDNIYLILEVEMMQI